MDDFTTSARAVLLCARRRLVATADKDGRVRISVLPPEPLKVRRPHPTQPPEAACVTFNAPAGWAPALPRFRIPTHTHTKAPELAGRRPCCLVLLPRPEQGAYEIQTYCQGHKNFVPAAAFVPTGTPAAAPAGEAAAPYLLVTGSGDGTVRLSSRVPCLCTRSRAFALRDILCAW